MFKSFYTYCHNMVLQRKKCLPYINCNRGHKGKETHEQIQQIAFSEASPSAAWLLEINGPLPANQNLEFSTLNYYL